MGEADRVHLSIGEIAESLHVSVATIRSWETRYGWPLSIRTAGGHRRYLAADVPQFLAVADLRMDVSTRAAIELVVSAQDAPSIST